MPRSILVATDFSEGARRALDYALDLGAQLGASLCLAHAYTLPAYVAPIEGSFIASPEYAAELSNRLQRQLDAEREHAKSRGVTPQTRLVLGVAHVELPKLAGELPADLIVVGTHGRTGLAHALIGSVAERIVRASSCPVLCVR